MEFCEDLNELTLYRMEDVSLPSDCTPDELQFEMPPIIELKLPDTDCLSKDSGFSQEIWCTPVKEEPESFDMENKRRKKKGTKNKAIKKAEADKKKVIKQMRNRISAQKSRDRKKQEMEDLRDETEKLRKENCDLKSQLQAAKDELQLLRQMRSKVNMDKSKGKNKKNSSGMFLFAALLLGCFYMTGCLSPFVKTSEIPEAAKELTMQNVNFGDSLLTKDDNLTSAQKERRKYIEEESKVHLQPKVRNQDLDIISLKSKESITGALSEGVDEGLTASIDKNYIKGPEFLF